MLVLGSVSLCGFCLITKTDGECYKRLAEVEEHHAEKTHARKKQG